MSGILVVKLGSMGDVIHTLPAAATLKHSFPGKRLTWIVDPRWAVLLEDNPFVDDVIRLNRRELQSIRSAWRGLREREFEFVVDFQGLIKSALAASAARPDRIYGFHQSQLREKLAALFYSHRIRTHAEHIVEQNLELAVATGAANEIKSFPLPPGNPEGDLPGGGFILASPLGGWLSKQWPLEHYRELSSLTKNELGLPLVVDGPPSAAKTFAELPGCIPHCSSVSGLISATRRAAAVIGIDSGPLHLAAALDKPGVAIFGPTDPARNGPFGGSLKVLRCASAVTTYKRRSEIDPSMRAVTPAEVLEALKESLGGTK